MVGSFGCRKFMRKIGVLVAQLGTPEAPTKQALRPYLKQFLGDPRVIEANRAVWWAVLNGIILNTRPKRSARLYGRIWTEQGSPLLTVTRDQTLGLKRELQKSEPSIEVEFGMRYGNPSIESAIDLLIKKGCSRILLFPMYPQYSAATSASTYDVVFAHLLKRRWVPTLRVAEPYFSAGEYIEPLALTINESLAKFTREWGAAPEKLVLSYHGIPIKYVEKGDPYCCMCTETTRELVPRLKIDSKNVIHTYQSRFGKDPWLQPYTDYTIQDLAKSGIKRIAVVAPGFPTDCLETLDELGNEARHLFEEHGGEKFGAIPCLNNDPRWISGMAGLALKEMSSWLSDLDNTSVDCPTAAVVPEMNNK